MTEQNDVLFVGTDEGKALYAKPDQSGVLYVEPVQDVVLHAGDVGAHRATVGAPTDPESINTAVQIRAGALENALAVEETRLPHGKFLAQDHPIPAYGPGGHDELEEPRDDQDGQGHEGLADKGVQGKGVPGEGDDRGRAEDRRSGDARQAEDRGGRRG